jgi:general stress protein 26
MTAAELLSFMREHWLAVQASVSMSGSAQAAAIGIVVTDDFEVFFDTVDESRKVENLRRNPRIALVVGGTTAGDERSDVRSAPSRAQQKPANDGQESA